MSGPGGTERRREPRYAVRIDVDYRAAETTLFAHITDISTMGICVAAPRPEPVGSRLALRFAAAAAPDEPPGVSTSSAIEVLGEVVWTTEGSGGKGHAGMGIRFLELAPEMRTRLLELVKAVAYLGGAG